MVDNTATKTNQNHHHQVGDISSEMLPQNDTEFQSKHTGTNFDSETLKMVDKAATENNQNYHHQVGDISSEMLPQSDSGSQSKHALSNNFDSGTLKMVDNAATENNQNHHHLVGDISSDMLPQSDSGSQSKHTLSTDFDPGTLRMVDNAAIENNKNHHHQAGDISSEMLPQSDSGSHSKHTVSIDSDLGTFKMVDNAAIENNQKDHHQAGDISNGVLPQSDSGSQSKHTLSIDSDSMGENAATSNDHNHQHRRHQIGDMSIEMLPLCASRRSDDEGSHKRTGNVWTASANIIVVMMVGTGVLSPARGIAQLGWIAGPAVILFFSLVGYYTSRFLSDCYRTGDPNTGDRNSTYMESVHSILGGANVKACGFLQYMTLFRNAIGCIVEASLCMTAIKYNKCLNGSNWENGCSTSSNPYMIIFAVTEILLSQIPDFNQIRWISVVAAVMLVTNSLIGLGLGITQLVDNGSFNSIFKVTGVGDETETFRALGGIATAYSFSQILIETQDTIGSPPSEAKTMKKAISRSTALMTTIYMLCGCIFYAAFGEATPENFLLELGVDKPWLSDISNAVMAIYLVGAYQVNSQPILAFVEKWADQRWRGSELIAKEIKIPVPRLGQYNMNLFRLVWRTAFVILTTVISMLVPFVFNEVVDIISLGFWPLMVYFPVEMYIRQKKIRRWSTKWVYLQMLSMTCLVISIMATVGSIPKLKDDLKDNRPFGMSVGR
ncbi:amino acid permease 4 [Eucalyptus grandis]|uniref:amino acid permease 4 n=1 Tax=Eucalyptus grandis TaxID=71139 RepID=UPI00192E83F6|nr:amino acid permease 4 [Eucalyptus grandis]